MMDNNQTKSDQIKAPADWALWAPPLVLIIFLIMFLIYLLVPGVLLYPTQQRNEPVFLVDPETTEQLNSNLNQKIRNLEDLIDRGQCTVDGLVLQDESISLMPPNSSSIGADNNQIVMLPPAENILWKKTDDGNNTSISDFLNKAVVYISVEGTDGSNYSGTGFFISENYILTNQHVISGAADGVVTIFRPNEMKPFMAAVVKSSQEFTERNEDFAVLRSSQSSDAFLQFAKLGLDLSLTPVLSAGFPGDVIDILREFDQDGQGIELEGLPLFLTDGVINAVQNFNSGGAALLHSAEISQGNSGGPLVNGCGEVLGVNTFTRSDTENFVRTLNIALRVDAVQSFLDRSGMNYTQSSGPCTPKLMPKNDG
ncbi:MAG: serine protease [Planktomarina sp.]|nr:serine protease [Planktomarina sp.]